MRRSYLQQHSQTDLQLKGRTTTSCLVQQIPAGYSPLQHDGCISFRPRITLVITLGPSTTFPNVDHRSSLFGGPPTEWVVRTVFGRHITGSTLLLVYVGVILLILDVNVTLTLMIAFALAVSIVAADATTCDRALHTIGLRRSYARPEIRNATASTPPSRHDARAQRGVGAVHIPRTDCHIKIPIISTASVPYSANQRFQQPRRLSHAAGSPLRWCCRERYPFPFPPQHSNAL